MLAILVDDLSPSQLAFEVLKLRGDNVGVFYKDNLQPCSDVRIFSSSWDDAIFCDSLLLTSVDSANYTLNFGPKKRNLLLWDLEWLRGKDCSVYKDKYIDILARSQSHREKFEKDWYPYCASLFSWDKIGELCK